MVAGLFSAIVFSGIIVLFLNFLITTLIVFFSSKILNFPNSTLDKAFLVSLSGFIIGFLQDVFFEVTFFFSWIIALLAFLWAIKKIYKVEYTQAFYLWLVSIILPIGLAILVVPIIYDLLVSIAF